MRQIFKFQSQDIIVVCLIHIIIKLYEILFILRNLKIVSALRRCCSRGCTLPEYSSNIILSIKNLVRREVGLYLTVEQMVWLINKSRRDSFTSWKDRQRGPPRYRTMVCDGLIQMHIANKAILPVAFLTFAEGKVVATPIVPVNKLVTFPIHKRVSLLEWLTKLGNSLNLTFQYMTHRYIFTNESSFLMNINEEIYDVRHICKKMLTVASACTDKTLATSDLDPCDL